MNIPNKIYRQCGRYRRGGIASPPTFSGDSSRTGMSGSSVGSEKIKASLRQIDCPLGVVARV